MCLYIIITIILWVLSIYSMLTIQLSHMHMHEQYIMQPTESSSRTGNGSEEWLTLELLAVWGQTTLIGVYGVLLVSLSQSPRAVNLSNRIGGRNCCENSLQMLQNLLWDYVSTAMYRQLSK